MALPRHGMTQEQIRRTQDKWGIGPHVAADLVVFSLRASGDEPEPVVLLIERKHAPFAGCLACPGGFVDLHEDLEPAARRELAEETGLTQLGRAYLEQLGAWGAPERDPRSRVISAVYLALVPWTELDRPRAGDDAARASYEVIRSGAPRDSQGKPRELAFDHSQVLATAWRRIGELARTTSAPLRLLPQPFTAAQLGRAWSVLLGQQIDGDAVAKRMAQLGWLVSAGGETWSESSDEVKHGPPWWDQ